MMDANKILQAHVLDLIFDGRNKEYGAYELRTNYSRRLLLAMCTMLAVCCCLVLLNSFVVKPRQNSSLPVTDTLRLVEIPDEDKPIEPPPVEPPRQQEPVKQVSFTSPPLITPDDVKPEDMPPPVEEIETAKIGTITTPGVDDDRLVAPPIDTKSTGVIEKPQPKDDDADKVHLIVQIESEYPGGLQAWLRYLVKNLPRHYTEDLVDRGIHGRVLVQFIVDKDGNVSDVQGVEGPAELREIAEAVIRKSGKWTPAINNGHHVKSYKRQPVVFALPVEE
jgi:periplasmic protein TonB